MSTPTVLRLWAEANQALMAGHLPRAVECLRRLLSEDPDYADAHALLALALVDMKRIVAAEMEAGIALRLEPGSVLGHRAMAHACTARRKFTDAEEHYERLLEMAPEDDGIHHDYGQLLALMGRRAEAEKELNQAIELDPEDPDNFTALGRFRLDAGNIEAAERFAQLALELQPRHLDALVLMGRIALRQGDVDQAREHAHWALSIDATDVGALYLMAAIKAKTNWFLGLWWRYSTWVMETGNRRVILVLLLAFVAYRVARQVLLDGGNESGAELVSAAWIGVCVYTWVGPGLFQRELQKELGQVRLKRDF